MVRTLGVTWVACQRKKKEEKPELSHFEAIRLRDEGILKSKLLVGRMKEEGEAAAEASRNKVAYIMQLAELEVAMKVGAPKF